jgi:hypothetical protein
MGLVAAKSSCAKSMTVTSPQIIPGYNWWVKLIQASECGSGLEQSLSTQLWPFEHISFICLVLREEGACQIPSISEAVLCLGWSGLGRKCCLQGGLLGEMGGECLDSAVSLQMGWGGSSYRP